MNKLYKEFVENNKKLVKEYINKKYNPVVVELKYKDYISNSKLEETLNNIILENFNSRVLVVAGTGSGKTRFFSNYYDNKIEEDTERNKGVINNNNKILKTHSNLIKTEDGKMRYSTDILDRRYYLLCPNKVQNLQNEQAYNFKALVSNTKINDNDMKISSVYDKSDEINNYINEYDYLTVDEAHYLVESKNFRGKALDDINNIINKCNHVFYLTATPFSLFLTEFTHIIFLEDINYKAKVNSINIIKTDSVLVKTRKIIEESKNPFLIGLNDTKELKKMNEMYNNIDIIYSKNKENNKVFNDIINDEMLTSEQLLCTSCMYAGTNLKKATFNTSKLDVYNMISKKKHFNITDTIQLFNRNRQQSNSWNLVFNNIKKEYKEEDLEKFKYKSICELFKDKYIQVKIQQKWLTKMIKLLSEIHNKESVCKQIELIMQYKNDKGCCVNSLNCLYLDEESLSIKIDFFALASLIYNKYNYLLSYNIDIVANLLKDVFNINVNIIDDNKISEEEIKKVLKEDKELAKDIKDKCFDIIKEDNDFIDIYIKKEGLDRINFKKKLKEEEREKIDILEEQSIIFKKYKEARYKVGRKTAIEVFNKYSKLADINNFLYEVQILELNTLYKKTKDISVYDSSNNKIIKFLVENYNKNGKRISKNDILKIKEFATNNKLKLSDNKIMYYLNITFNLNYDDKNKSYKISSLKSKLKN